MSKIFIKKVEHTAYTVLLDREEAIAHLRALTDGQIDYADIVFSEDNVSDATIVSLIRQELNAAGQLYDNITQGTSEGEALWDEWTVEAKS